MLIIDVIAEGMDTARKKPWLLAFPVLMDLGLWWGPKLSIAPVIDSVITTFRQAAEAYAAAGGADSNLRQMVDPVIAELQGSLGRTNLLSLLAWGRLGIPSVAGLRLIQPEVDRVIPVSGYGSMLGLQALIMVIGLLLSCLFLSLLGQQVRGGSASLGKALQRAPAYWLYSLVIFVPLGIVLVMALTFGLLLGPVGPFLWIALLWLALYIVFVPQAITMDEQRPLAALLGSFTVVRFNFWSTLGLILLTNVINTGLTLIWRPLLGSIPGTVVAILINAYVGTGLALAAFVFYRDRLAVWQKTLEQQRSMGSNGRL